MLEGHRVSRISVRGFAVASATAVTTVGAVVGVASGDPQHASTDNLETTASDATLLADIPSGQQAQVLTASLAQQASAQSAAADQASLKNAEEQARIQAAHNAKAKKQAADDKAEAAKKAKEAKEAAAKAKAEQNSIKSASAFAVQSSYSASAVQAMARQMMPADQFQCFSNIVTRESGWNYTATNAGSGAYGLVQALPGSKMASAGADWQTNPATQIKWGLNYMDSRYGSPCGAWSFWQAHSWY
ncbi:lytic transglycosylase domain-containing protein [Streptomyces fuscigenes]|nr:lytic transglycosylase domain-containing protein [Streptomyces fuscigenes]MCF3962467.1 lytic transglycosylase domain-containing protein [Streptomyces fuscigenes]